MDKANPVIMDSSTYGLPVNSAARLQDDYPPATRISVDGIHLHQLNSTVWAQGKENVSHGCPNLSGENAEWFYNSVPGDIVEIRNTGGDPPASPTTTAINGAGISGSRAALRR